MLRLWSIIFFSGRTGHLRILSVAALILLASLLVGCWRDRNENRPLAPIPFDAGKSGDGILAGFCVERAQEYAVVLSFLYDSEDAYGRKMIWDAIEGLPGSETQPRYRIIVERFEEGRVVSLVDSEVEISKPYSSGWGRVNSRLLVMDLVPGSYILRVDGLRNSVQFSSLRANVLVIKPYRGK